MLRRAGLHQARLRRLGDAGTTGGTASTGSWLASRAAFAFANVPQLTAYKEYPIAATPMGATLASAATDDGLMEGGAVAASGGSVAQVFTKAITLSPRTGLYHVDFDGRLILGTTACEFGLGNATLSNFIAVALVNPTLTWVLRTQAAPTPTTFFGDANEHIFGIGANGTTVSFYVDEGFIGSFAQSGVTLDEPYYPFMISTGAANTIALQQLGYGYA